MSDVLSPECEGGVGDGEGWTGFDHGELRRREQFTVELKLLADSLLRLTVWGVLSLLTTLTFFTSSEPTAVVGNLTFSRSMYTTAVIGACSGCGSTSAAGGAHGEAWGGGGHHHKLVCTLKRNPARPPTADLSCEGESDPSVAAGGRVQVDVPHLSVHAWVARVEGHWHLRTPREQHHRRVCG